MKRIGHLFACFMDSLIGKSAAAWMMSESMAEVAMQSKHPNSTRLFYCRNQVAAKRAKLFRVPNVTFRVHYCLCVIEHEGQDSPLQIVDDESETDRAGE